MACLSRRLLTYERRAAYSKNAGKMARGTDEEAVRKMLVARTRNRNRRASVEKGVAGSEGATEELKKRPSHLKAKEALNKGSTGRRRPKRVVRRISESKRLDRKKARVKIRFLPLSRRRSKPLKGARWKRREENTWANILETLSPPERRIQRNDRTDRKNEKEAQGITTQLMSIKGI